VTGGSGGLLRRASGVRPGSHEVFCGGDPVRSHGRQQRQPRQHERGWDGMSDNVTMTAYNEATEPDRIDRLSRVGKALQRKRRIRLTGSIMSEPTPIIETSIRALHDHKGVLFVDWEEQPTTQEISAVSRAWLFLPVPTAVATVRHQGFRFGGAIFSSSSTVSSPESSSRRIMLIGSGTLRWPPAKRFA
jgi:hypothetical protein